ncbi:hypothetical protein [Arthrobacter sp. 92]|uniref:hypothetical protein n=1 Tax=Arthrobacter sp. 92 TaxID=3418175 RepID=UPI003CFBC76F
MRFIQSLKQRITAGISAFNSSADPQQQAREARSELPQAMSTAQARLDGTKNFVASLPAAVGPGVHQRIAEAEGSLRSAISAQAGDPVNALAHARWAADLASQAGQLAQAEANANMRGYAGGPIGVAGGGNGGGFARGLGAGVLGGIAGNMLFGGLLEDRDGGEGHGFEAMGGDDGFGGDTGGFGGGDDGSF